MDWDAEDGDEDGEDVPEFQEEEVAALLKDAETEQADEALSFALIAKRNLPEDFLADAGRDWQILLATSKDVTELKKRGSKCMSMKWREMGLAEIWLATS